MIKTFENIWMTFSKMFFSLDQDFKMNDETEIHIAENKMNDTLF